MNQNTFATRGVVEIFLQNDSWLTKEINVFYEKQYFFLNMTKRWLNVRSALF